MEQPKEIKPVSAEYLTFLQDYWDTFLTEKGKRVLDDFRVKYCGSCFDKDPIKMAFLNGQREVILEIEEVLSQKDLNIKLEEEENG